MLNNNCIFELVHDYITFCALIAMYIVSYNKNASSYTVLVVLIIYGSNDSTVSFRN